MQFLKPLGTTMATHLHVFFFFIMAIIISLSSQFTNGFTIDLIHRDSPLSPFHNHSKTPSELLTEAFQRSISRAKHFQKTLSSFDEKDVESDVLPDGGDYVMKISLGTPPTETYAFADTGSDLVWVQCSPCLQCYPQTVPLFDSTKSSTFKRLSCNSRPCLSLGDDRVCGLGYCLYNVSYGDGSFTIGNLAMETLSFGSNDGKVASFPNSVFGCGRKNAGVFNQRTSGIVGLGAGPLSLVSQLGPKIGRKFSYCLVPFSSSSSSKLKLGNEAIVNGSLISTPITSKPDGVFYYLTLEGITVGNKNVPWQGKGNIIIDSGSTLTTLEQSFYNNLKASIIQAIGVTPVQDPSGLFSLCYDNLDVRVPEMVFHFAGGVDLRLPEANTFLLVNNGLLCLAIVPGPESVFGNISQVDFQVGYDLDAGSVSFAPADCTKV